MSKHLDEPSLSGYLDGTLSLQEMQAAKAHLQACPACQARLERMRALVRMLRETPMVEPPPELSPRILAAIRQDSAQESQRQRRWGRRLHRGAAAAAAMVLIAGSLTLALGGGPASIHDAMRQPQDTWSAPMEIHPFLEEVETPEADPQPQPEDAASAPMAGPMGASQDDVADQSASLNVSLPRSGGLESAELQKIVYTASCTQATYQFAEDKSSILAKTHGLGGFVQFNTTAGVSYIEGGSGLHAELVLRIPQKSYAEMMGYLSQVGTQKYVSESAENIGQVYSDENIRLANLQAQHEALLELMDQAQSLEDVLLLQTELNTVSTEIEQSQSALRNMDQQISYATVNVTLEELRATDTLPVSSEDLTLGERMRQSLYRNLARLRDGSLAVLVGLVGAIPLIGLLGLVAVVVLVIIILVRRRRGRQQPKPSEDEDAVES